MSATNVGEIGLDLVVNQKQFNRQMTGITNLVKKAGSALAAAFAVKKVVQFGKECLELGSDLAEVQNVVDVTFPAMTAQVDKFAKSAITTFGLSETMAKKFTGTYGAMAKAFGFSEQAAYEMSSTLTGLAGDVASFYNISQDEAYTKLKSVFSGETETLKDLGIVMTQSALDAFALEKGYGKVTAKMSEAEKVALRYAFVQDKLSAAQGDFARTSDSWANQTRILKLQLDSIKATLGQGFINLFTPIIKAANTLLGKLATLANAFKSFTELITGNKAKEGSGIGKMASEAAESAENLEENTAGVGAAAKKAAKEMRALMGFDQINKVAEADESEDSGSDAGGIGSSVDFGGLAEGENVLEKTDSKFQGLIDRVKELAGLFKQGFEIGFGNSEEKIQSIGRHIEGIEQSLKRIFADEAVRTAADGMFDSFALNLGKVTGSAARVGLTIADNLLGGFDQYLQNNESYIKERLVSIFNVSGEIADSIGDLSVAAADILDVFSGDTAKECTEHLIGIFSDAFLGVTDLRLQLGNDILRCIVDPIIENKDKIKEALENTLAPVETVLESLHGLVQNTFRKIFQVYEEYLEPAFDNISSGLSTVFAGVLDAYNNYLAPVLGWISERFSALVDEYIQPLVDAFLDFAGKAIEALSMLWDFVSPFVSWILEKFIMQLAEKFQWLWTKIEVVVSIVAAVVQGIIEACSGLIDFIVGIFTGDWEKAWTGVKEIFGGICTAIQGVFQGVGNFISNVFTTITTTAGNALDLLKNIVTKALTAIKTVFTNIFNGIKNTVTSIFNGIWGLIKNVINSILGGVESMANGVVSAINTVVRALNGLSFTTPDWIPGIGGKTFGFNLGELPKVSIPRLAQGGYVKANTPQLAMIGDNRHQGEVVAPEDKLQDMVNAAVRAAAGMGGVTREELEQIINGAVMRIVAALASVGFHVDGEQLAALLQSAKENLDWRYNAWEIT